MAGDDFLFLGAHRALDFVNTRTVDRGLPVERLGDFGALVAWARAAKLLRSADADAAYTRWPGHRDAVRVHAEAVALRESVRDWLREPAALDALLDRVNADVRHFEPRGQVMRVGERLCWRTWLDGAGPEILLRTLALEVANLLCAVPRDQLRRCQAGDCEAWFRAYDRTAARCWCSVARCAGRHRTSQWRAAQRRGSPR
jgi:predicted RNA-binding Zn ribbon-like protein